MNRFISLLALGAVLFLAGCSPAFNEELVDTAPPELEGGWSVKMTQSGGIMGLMRSVEITSDGSITISDDRLEKSITGKLPDSDVRILKELVAGSHYFISEFPNSVCADCFVYHVEIQSGKQTFIAQLDDITLPDSGMEPLVSFLLAIMDANIR